jgi:uncharacterized protein (DUF433 family)
MERTKAEIGSAVYEHAVELAKAHGRDEGEMIDELIEESIRMREHPGIGFKGGPAGRRAWVMGTGLDVWEIVEMHRSMGRETLPESMENVSEASLEAALSYHDSYPEEIEAALKENALPPEYWHGLHPETIPPSPETSPGD